MEQKSIKIFTLGCKVNQYETQAILEKFIKKGYKIAKDTEIADIYIINTCAVTEESEKKCRKIINRIRKNNPNAIIGVIGCYAQVAPEKITGVNFIGGNTEKVNIVEKIEKIDSSSINKPYNIVKDIMVQKEFEEIGNITYSENTRAFIKIQEGCNNRCTYCLIPFARGPARSRKIENIIEEIKILTKNNFKEIVLTGINLSFYGKDIGNISLLDLLREIKKISELKRIRFGSVYLEIFTEEFLNYIKTMPEICPHFHISLQSGCDTVLKRMGRRYTIKEYDEILKRLKNIMPDLSVTTDIIVGFPGETDGEFEQTYNYLKNSLITRFHVFPYSKREGTVASKMEIQINEKIKKERVNRLIELSKLKEIEFYERHIGKNMNVLFEQKVGKDEYEGHTENFIKVRKKFDKDVVGEIINLQIF